MPWPPTFREGPIKKSVKYGKMVVNLEHWSRLGSSLNFLVEANLSLAGTTGFVEHYTYYELWRGAFRVRVLGTYLATPFVQRILDITQS